MTAQFRAWLASWIAQQPLAFAAAMGVLFVIVSAITDAAVFGTRTRHIDSVQALQEFYRELGYVEPAMSAGKIDVPRIYLSRMPGWWRDIKPIAAKKSMFFRSLLPLVLKVNEDIAKDRRRLQQIAATYHATRSPGDADDRAWLQRLAARYHVPSAEPEESLAPVIAALLQRVDTIPPSLALAQAAVESGYGVSRFALEANALYGQWRTGGGVRPRAQPAHLRAFGIAAFRSPLASVAAYAHNLNTSAPYRAFRALRAKQHRSGRNPAALAATLTAYSARGLAYVVTVQRVIEDNRLARFDGARLGDGRTVIIELL